MEIMRSDEIDLTLDEDSSSNHTEEKTSNKNDKKIDKGSSEKSKTVEINIISSNETSKSNRPSQIGKETGGQDIIIHESPHISVTNYEHNEEISKLVKHEEKLENGQYIYIFSCGPFQQQENKIIRPINCHPCRYSTNNFDEINIHIASETHKRNITHLISEKRFQCVYNLYDSSPKEFKIMICLFGGENIAEVHEENKNRLVYFCKSTNRLKVQKIVLNVTKKDILAEVNKNRPILGLEYCIKFSNNFSYFCVLCNEHILKDPLIHFAGKLHINNFIVRHFLLTRDKISTLMKDVVHDPETKHESIEKIVLLIYNDLEKRHKLKKINILEQKMFNCFRNHFVKIVCNRKHYCDDHIAQMEINAIIKEYIEKLEKIKSEYQNESMENEVDSELVIIGDENENDQNCLPMVEGGNKNGGSTNPIVEIESGTIDENSDELNKENNSDNLISTDDQNLLILDVEKEFNKLTKISDIKIFDDPISDEDGPIYWEKSSFSLEYICRFKYCNNGQEMSKSKCTLCNKYLTDLFTNHATSSVHRMLYINKHFPILKSYFRSSLSQMNFSGEKENTIIGQMIAEICQRLQKRTKKLLNQCIKINIKKFYKHKLMDNYMKRICTEKLHYDDRFFISVYKEKSERAIFLEKLIRKFTEYYGNSDCSKRKIPDDLNASHPGTKRTKLNDSMNVPITLISVLKLIVNCKDLEQVKLETNRLLTHAEEMEKVNGNITELMKSIEYLNFFKKVMEMLKDMIETVNVDNIPEERMRSINRILDNSTLLIESMEEGIGLKEAVISDVLTIDDDDEPEFISSTDSNNALKKLPNPFNSKFKKPTVKSNTAPKASQQQNFQTAYANNRNIVNNEIRVNNRSIGQSYMNINRPNSTILTLNPNRYNNPVLNVTTYSETTQMNMSIPLLGNPVNNQNQYRNIFVNNQQNQHHRFQNANINFSSYASRATSVQQSGLRPPTPSITPQSVRPRMISPAGIPIVLSNATSQSSTATAQNSIFNARINFRASVPQPPPPPQPSSFQHVSISNNRQVHNFNNIHGNTLSITQRFQAIRPPFTLNSTFPGAYANTRNLFAGRTNF
ncbi:uncharacterized protein LOC129613387 [Condylostylus longicornis]|uniref:uncharacterized protein LOC129613387 n=1 Tax=Condylostylus longicornis TaxID=2530218 RepID=UPI00244E41DA|nr:uncharacterized protein LOC129613387 [Condylostylus longicornis]